MSGKTEKAKRKVEKEKDEDFIKRREALRKEFAASSKKYKVDIKAGLKYELEALLPIMVFVDMKEHYGHVTEEAKKAEAEKNVPINGQLKPNLKTKLKV